MAGEAVLKIKETEDRGKELIRASTEEARQIADNYAKNSAEQRDAMLVKAENTKAEIIEAAAKKAGAECEELGKHGALEKEAILNPGAEKLEQAIKFITERIVSV